LSNTDEFHIITVDDLL